MRLLVTGLSHKTAPVDAREKLSIPETRVPHALASLKAHAGLLECVILSTCNRTEVYACAAGCVGDSQVVEWLSEYCCVPVSDFAQRLYSLGGPKAAEHLFRVAAGIDSMVIGEDQILGQVKTAHVLARRAGATGPVLNFLFQHAVSVGKKARSETAIGRGAFSVGSVAVRLAESIFQELKGLTVFVLGAGKMAEITINHLVRKGVSDLLVGNRTHPKAEALAAKFNGCPVGFDRLASALHSADILICSTGSEQPIITQGMVAAAMTSRRGKPMFCIDIAVPRDIEPAVGDIDGVFLYNIDDLEAVIRKDVAQRQSEIEKVERIIAQELAQFSAKFRALDAVPVITALREKFEQIRQTELAKLKKRLPQLSAQELDAFDAATRSIVNRICHHPVLRIKDYAAAAEPAIKLESICELFGICPVESEPEELDDEVR